MPAGEIPHSDVAYVLASVAVSALAKIYLARNPRHGKGGRGDLSKFYLPAYPKLFVSLTQDSVWETLVPGGEMPSPGDITFQKQLAGIAC